MQKPLGSHVYNQVSHHPLLTLFRTGLYAESHGIVANVSTPHCIISRSYPLRTFMIL